MRHGVPHLLVNRFDWLTHVRKAKVRCTSEVRAV
jgi:hypothetical protein